MLLIRREQINSRNYERTFSARPAGDGTYHAAKAIEFEYFIPENITGFRHGSSEHCLYSSRRARKRGKYFRGRQNNDPRSVSPNIHWSGWLLTKIILIILSHSSTAGAETVCPPRATSCRPLNSRFKTYSTLQNFAAVMLMFPEVQAKAQQEIDSVLGQGRLPDFQDRQSLPYVECVLWETLRYVSR